MKCKSIRSGVSGSGGISAKASDGRIRKSPVLILALLIFSLFALHMGEIFFFSAVSAAGQDVVQLRLGEPFLTGSAVKRLTENQALSADSEETAPAERILCTAWTQKNGVMLKNSELGRTLSADVIFYAGDDNPRFRLTLDNGCAITEKQAFQLWGVGSGKDILGSSLRMGERDYVVEQVLPQGAWTGGAALVRAPETTPLTFDVLELYRGSGLPVSPEEIIAAENLNNRVTLDYGLLQAMLAALRVLPVWCGALFLTIPWIFKSDRQKVCFRLPSDRIKRRVLTAGTSRFLHRLAGFLTIVLTAILFGSPFVIPQSFIPTRWSDFSFWSARMEAAAEAFHSLVAMPCYGPDLYFRQAALGAILCCAGEGIVVCVLLHTLFIKRSAFRSL